MKATAKMKNRRAEEIKLMFMGQPPHVLLSNTDFFSEASKTPLGEQVSRMLMCFSLSVRGETSEPSQGTA